MPFPGGRGSIRRESLNHRMPDQIRYDLLTQQALRGVVRAVLTDAAKKGLPGDHHFYISFNTTADGARLSQRLRAQYPEEMTIILQHQFWDLTVDNDGFEVGLSFGGVPEKLSVPFEAVTGFFDPSVQFGLQFEPVGEGQDNAAPAPAVEAKVAEAKPAEVKSLEVKSPKARSAEIGTAPAKSAEPKPADARKRPAGRGSVPAVAPANPEPPPDPDKPDGGAEVVRLDRFRKK